MKIFNSLLLATSLVTGAHAALVEKAVSYQQGGATLEGFHVYDGAVAGKRPAVLVIHQWTGLTEYEKRRSRMLAALGYNVFAADIYGQGIRPQPPEAGKEAGKYKGDRALYRARLTAALVGGDEGVLRGAFSIAPAGRMLRDDGWQPQAAFGTSP